MGNNKYVKIHSLLRMFAALLAIIVFISMFAAKQVVHSEYSNVFFDFRNGAFFGDEVSKGNVVGFFAYLLVFIGGLAGLAFVFIDEIIGKDLTKTLSFVVGGAMVVGAIFMLLTGVFFRAFNSDGFGINKFHLAAGPIVFGILAIIAGCCNAAAPILEDKGL